MPAGVGGADVLLTCANEPETTNGLEIQPRNVELTTSKHLSLLKIGRAFAQSRKVRDHAQLIDGRTRSISGTRASSSNDRRSRWRCDSVSQTSRAADGTSARLLSESLRTNWAWSCRSGGSSAGGIDRGSYPSAYVRSVATLHALDPCDRALQVSGLSPAHQILIQGYANRTRR